MTPPAAVPHQPEAAMSNEQRAAELLALQLADVLDDHSGLWPGGVELITEAIDAAAAVAWDEGYQAAQLDADEQPYSDRPEAATWKPRANPYRDEDDR